MRNVEEWERDLDARDLQYDSWLIELGIVVAVAMVAALVIWSV